MRCVFLILLALFFNTFALRLRPEAVSSGKPVVPRCRSMSEIVTLSAKKHVVRYLSTVNESQQLCTHSVHSITTNVIVS